jgi:hypothetical protein
MMYMFIIRSLLPPPSLSYFVSSAVTSVTIQSIFKNSVLELLEPSSYSATHEHNFRWRLHDYLIKHTGPPGDEQRIELILGEQPVVDSMAEQPIASMIRHNKQKDVGVFYDLHKRRQSLIGSSNGFLIFWPVAMLMACSNLRLALRQYDGNKLPT